MLHDDFIRLLKRAKNVVAITGAGISAESGIPTFRGAGGYWRKYQATSLASPHAFQSNPSLVWEFYHYRRCVVNSFFNQLNRVCENAHIKKYRKTNQVSWDWHMGQLIISKLQNKQKM